MATDIVARSRNEIGQATAAEPESMKQQLLAADAYDEGLEGENNGNVLPRKANEL